MPLQLDVPYFDGSVTAKYHRIQAFGYDRTAIGAKPSQSGPGLFTVRIASYFTAATAGQERALIQERIYAWNNDEFQPNWGQNLLNQIYAKLKTLPEWQGATDV